MSRVAAIPCVVGQLGWSGECSGRLELHYLREGQGAAQRASDFLVIPVCTGHHTGAFGIHQRKAFYVRTKLDELDLLAFTLEQLNLGDDKLARLMTRDYESIGWKV